MRKLWVSNPLLVGSSWVAAYMLITLVPLLVLLLNVPLDSRGFWTEFSVALGFIGLAMMCVQFFLTARHHLLEDSYGIDIILQFHRHISVVAVIFLLVHPLILMFTDTEGMLRLLNFPIAPWRARCATLSLLALVLLILTSIWRKKLKLSYEIWRNLHGILAIGSVGLGVGHAIGVSYYLSNFWKQLLWVAIVGLAVSMLFRERILSPFLMLKKPYEVERVIPQRGNVWSLVLKPKGHDGIRFAPGQFAWITVGDTPFGDQEHPFSFSNSSERFPELEFSIKALGDFTATIKQIEPGTVAYLDGPFGVFTTERHKVSAGFFLVAGGIGVTPIMSMLRTLADQGDPRPVTLIYSSRCWEEITFREELEDLQTRLNLTVVHVLRHPEPEWTGERGYVDRSVLARYLPQIPASRQYFICASAGMMHQVEQALIELGAPMTQIQMEHFDLV